MIVWACAEDKQACLHGNSCDAHAHLRDTPIFWIIKTEKTAKPDNRGSG